MSTFLKLTILGNLGKDPTIQHHDDGKVSARFSVAVNRRWMNRDGISEEETTWLRVTAWGRLAELCYERLQKGSKIYLEGRLVPDRTTGCPRIWHSAGGEIRANYDVKAHEIRFLSKLRFPKPRGKIGESGEGEGIPAPLA